MGISQKPGNGASKDDKYVAILFRLYPQEEDVCFRCGDPISPPCIYWSGHTPGSEPENVIYLHVKCAARLIDGLAQDLQFFLAR